MDEKKALLHELIVNGPADLNNPFIKLHRLDFLFYL